MTDASGPKVHLAQAMRTQAAMRQELGLGEETFPLPAFIGMLSDEIEQMRGKGHDDAEIAAFISEHSGVPIDADTVTRHYAEPDERAHG